MSAQANQRTHTSIFNTTLLVVGLGYCIDAFDLFLYNALRVSSLRDLGLEGDALTKAGLYILNLQIVGMLIGGLLWGILGDKIGRKKALIGSVLLYSLGSLGCAFITNVELYALLRFLTGIGLAGEMGLGAVLVAETVSDRQRGWGVALYALFAYVGIVAANLLGSWLPWRTCYAIGGAIGLFLLFGRMVLFESGLYEQLLHTTKVARGSLKLLLKKPDLLKRWLCCIFFTMPYFYTVNLLITLAPEFGKAVGVSVPIKAPTALMLWSGSAFFGTILAAIVSRMLQRRILAIAIYLVINLMLSAWYLMQNQPSEIGFYMICAVTGLANFFVLELYVAIEQFGTNMRATGGTSALSIGRSTLVITNSVFLALRASGVDILSAAAWTGAGAYIIGFICLLGLRETYHQSMDFLEERK
ncbi:MAG: MFS transporter [Alphaproteobacteria bacterium]|nr:MFS transporter [Alphaproteobacteria bacterium]